MPNSSLSEGLARARRIIILQHDYGSVSSDSTDADAPIQGTHHLHHTSEVGGDEVPLVPKVGPLITAGNVPWSSLVLPTGSAVSFAIYTGTDTHAMVNTSDDRTIGLRD